MRRMIQFAGLLLAGAMLAGCGGRSEENPNRWYLESQAPCPVSKLAQAVPGQLLDKQTDLKLYALNESQPESAVHKIYPKNSVSPRQIVEELPLKGNFKAVVTIGTGSQAESYSAIVRNGIVELEN